MRHAQTVNNSYFFDGEMTSLQKQIQDPGQSPKDWVNKEVV